MTDRVFPPASDSVEFTIMGDKIGLYCLICGEPLPESVDYLNQAIALWYMHIEEIRAAMAQGHSATIEGLEEGATAQPSRAEDDAGSTGAVEGPPRARQVVEDGGEGVR
jgi:hypothetical protein